MRQQILDYLNEKLDKMIAQHCELIIEKDIIRDSGKYRKITNINKREKPTC